ncbi:MAG TPA: exodeoxyribonuclease VII small subunit [Myxococcota bacterium]|nr:exodeoxyribonuclease VII small subunit [Myxococcota bacterium]
MNGGDPKAPPAPAGETEPRFEDLLERLRATVEKLESGQLSLEDSLRVYEEGVRLHRQCNERLDAADRRIERLLDGDAGGAPRTAPFEPPREEG